MPPNGNDSKRSFVTIPTAYVGSMHACLRSFYTYTCLLILRNLKTSKHAYTYTSSACGMISIFGTNKHKCSVYVHACIDIYVHYMKCAG